MEKTFTVNVPDDLWVDSWDQNKEQTYTYNGPETIYVVVQLTEDFPIIEWSEDPILREVDPNKQQIIELDANEQTAIAYYYYHNADEWEYEYTTITNHDGSTHEEYTNPTLEDIYQVVYSIQDGFVLSPIIRETETEAEKIAKGRLTYVQKYKNAYDFDEDVTAVINTFESNINNYLDTMATVYPWRYVNIDTTEIPKIPASLITVFNTLPEVE